MSEQTHYTNSYYNELAHKWSTGTITAEERQILEQWYSQEQDAAVTVPAELAVSEAVHEAQLLQKIQQRIAAEHSATPVRTLRSRNYWWAAAAVILLLCAGGYIWQTQTRQQQVPTAKVKVQDIAPGKAGAILTLADGSTMVLDSMPNGVITTQQGTQVVLKNGQLAYQQAAGSATATGSNTITTPRGRQFVIALQDGTNVWLNAASSLTFPTAFTGKDRVVSVTGEAYFEVAKTGTGAVNRPFKVKVNNQAEVEVLGTQFNVNAYADEAGMQTTLLQGAVRISANNDSKVLKPGQAAKIPAGNTAGITVVKHADTEQAIAWKNGSFYFKERTGIEEVMRQLSRWYDVEVVYVDGIPNAVFTGEMERTLSLMQMIKGLDNMGVRFTIEGRKLLVSSDSK
ncbi:FecR family protein [Filimonas lacunae]|uniref:FecR family protein n=1 Tax=Filimonas lacunae TaxID=477680 RepID=A0A173MBZ5_9BACT|nr:FecR family protein [Filimonas lacunae]BAV05103.1 anti-sigma factor [Filimonas lacunae]SIT34228.1 FecR family protein [Filimonas lacunae]